MPANPQMQRRMELLAKQLAATYPPRSREDFLGKEHFQKLAEEIDEPKKITSILFIELCFPLVNGVGVPPEELGLEVKTRDEAGVPHPGKAVLRHAVTNRRQREYRLTADNPHGVNDLVIGVGGVILLPEMKVQPDFSRQTEGILPLISGRLAELVPA
jgi:hypothetical protein